MTKLEKDVCQQWQQGVSTKMIARMKKITESEVKKIIVEGLKKM